MYSIHEQYVDTVSGFHVIALRDEYGSRHLVQIAVGATSCPACGAVYPKDNLGAIDPKELVATVNASLNQSQQNMTAYAKKHGVRVKTASHS